MRKPIAQWHRPKKQPLKPLNTFASGHYEAAENGTLHGLKFYSDDGEWILWIPDGPPMPHRIVIKLSDRGNTTDGGKQSMQPTSTASILFANWDRNPTFEDDDFEIAKPQDGQAFASISALIASMRPHGPNPLLRKPAPRVLIRTIEGQQVELTQHRCKHIVVLDFWSVRSGTSRISLPIFARTRTAYRDKGVVFYAVNVRDDADSVREYLENAMLNLDTVIMDQDGKTADAYRISGLPQSFIIDKRGKVQVVIRGYSSDLESRFAKELEVLLNEHPAINESNSESHSRSTGPAGPVKANKDDQISDNFK